jgi:diguanylate cyclase (GGDEF)-like protein/PAS domain S-box-containing protein
MTQFIGHRDKQSRKSSIAVPLQMAGFLSALIFLIGFTLEVLVINNLYLSQHILVVVLMIALAVWAIIEVYAIRRSSVVVPLRFLKIALWLQLLLCLFRGAAELMIDPHVVGLTGMNSGPDFGLALIFAPLDLAVFMLISRLIINAFSYTEFLRANQLAQQMEALETAQLALQQSEERYRLIASWVDDVIWTLDDRGHFNYISPSIEKLTGYAPHELLQQPLSGGLREDSALRLAQASRAALAQVELGRPIEPIRLELEQIRRDGNTFWSEVTMNGLYGPDHRFIGFVGVSRDISERKGYESDLREARDAAEAANLALLSANARLHGQATTDALTGASNRRYFEEALAVQITQTRSYGEPLCLLIIDIDNFKMINDRFGHQMGDLVIVELARLLQAGLRKPDLLARWGGDEFVVMLPHTPTQEAFEMAERLRLSMAVHVFPVVPQVTGSFGVAELQPEESAEDWFARVDRVLYAAKAAGRNQVKLSA